MVIAEIPNFSKEIYWRLYLAPPWGCNANVVSLLYSILGKRTQSFKKDWELLNNVKCELLIVFNFFLFFICSFNFFLFCFYYKETNTHMVRTRISLAKRLIRQNILVRHDPNTRNNQKKKSQMKKKCVFSFQNICRLDMEMCLQWN